MAQVEITGSASDVWNLLSHIRNAAAANGYTENQYVAGNPGLGILRLTRNGKFFNIYAQGEDPLTNPPEDLGAALKFSLSSGYTSSTSEGTQPDETTRTVCNLTPGPYQNHWFFVDDNVSSQEAVFAGVVEFQSGYFRSFAFGDCRKQGSYAGGEFVGAVYWYQYPPQVDVPESNGHNRLFEGMYNAQITFSHLRADLTGFKTWRFGDSQSQKAIANMGNNHFLGMFTDYINEGPNPWNERTLTHPIYFFTIDDTGSARAVPRGYLPTIHIVNIRNYQPGDVLPGTDFKVFPVSRKNKVGLRDDTENSEEYGFAFKFQ